MARKAYSPSDNEAGAIREGIKEISIAFSKIELEKENIKAIKDNLKESTNIPTSVLGKLIKAYINKDITEQREAFDEFEELYNSILGK